MIPNYNAHCINTSGYVERNDIFMCVHFCTLYTANQSELTPTCVERSLNEIFSTNIDI